LLQVDIETLLFPGRLVVIYASPVDRYVDIPDAFRLAGLRYLKNSTSETFPLG
jgi:hypothetical protein